MTYLSRFVLSFLPSSNLCSTHYSISCRLTLLNCVYIQSTHTCRKRDFVEMQNVLDSAVRPSMWL